VHEVQHAKYARRVYYNRLDPPKQVDGLVSWGRLLESLVCETTTGLPTSWWTRERNTRNRTAKNQSKIQVKIL